MKLSGRTVLTLTQAKPIFERVKRYFAAETKFVKQQARLARVLEKDLQKIGASLTAMRLYANKAGRFLPDEPVHRHLAKLENCVAGVEDDETAEGLGGALALGEPDRECDHGDLAWLIKTYREAVDHVRRAEAAAIVSRLKPKKKAPAAEATEADFSGAHQTIEPPPEPAEVTEGGEDVPETVGYCRPV